MTAARDVLRRSALQAHPEGGCYAEIWRGEPGENGRPLTTAILFLLDSGERSHWQEELQERIEGQLARSGLP